MHRVLAEKVFSRQATAQIIEQWSHHGAVIALLAVTGLTHRQAYRDIFAATAIKTLAVRVVIAARYITGAV